jgi:hypothetical protein
MKDGTIHEQGTYKELSAKNEEFQDMMNAYGGVTDEATTESIDTLLAETSDDVFHAKEASARIGKVMTKNSLEGGKELIEKEDRDIGAVKGEVWLAYMHASGGYAVFALAVLTLFINQASKIGNGILLIS